MTFVSTIELINRQPLYEFLLLFYICIIFISTLLFLALPEGRIKNIKEGKVGMFR